MHERPADEAMYLHLIVLVSKVIQKAVEELDLRMYVGVVHTKRNSLQKACGLLCIQRLEDGGNCHCVASPRSAVTDNLTWMTNAAVPLNETRATNCSSESRGLRSFTEEIRQGGRR